jgi:hypothetical protein
MAGELTLVILCYLTTKRALHPPTHVQCDLRP